MRTFAAATTVPGNLIFFKVLRENPGTLTLRKADGSVVAASIRTIGSDRVFAPNEPVAAGETLTLEYSTYCAELSDPTLAQTFTFQTSEHRQLRTQASSLELLEEGLEAPGDKVSEAAFVRLHYLASGDDATKHLIEFDIKVDGMPYQTGLVDGHGVVELRTYCGQGPESSHCGGPVYPSHPEGAHLVELTTTVVGAAQQPTPVQQEVYLSCDEQRAAQASSTTSSASSNGGDRPFIIDEIEEKKSDGCSVRPGQRQGDMLSLLTLLSGAFLLARARRRQRV